MVEAAGYLVGVEGRRVGRMGETSGVRPLIDLNGRRIVRPPLFKELVHLVVGHHTSQDIEETGED